MNDKPTELTVEDIDKFVKNLMDGVYDVKPKPCSCCKKRHIPSYGWEWDECDECYFARFPKDQVKKFCQSIIDEMM